MLNKAFLQGSEQASTAPAQGPLAASPPRRSLPQLPGEILDLILEQVPPFAKTGRAAGGVDQVFSPKRVNKNFTNLRLALKAEGRPVDAKYFPDYANAIASCFARGILEKNVPLSMYDAQAMQSVLACLARANELNISLVHGDTFFEPSRRGELSRLSAADQFGKKIEFLIARAPSLEVFALCMNDRSRQHACEKKPFYDRLFASLSRLARLQQVVLSSCDLSREDTLQSICALKHLRRLEIRECNLSGLAAEIWQIPLLQKLVVTGALLDLPEDGADQAQNLREVAVSYGFLGRFPAGFVALTQLRSFSLKHNGVFPGNNTTEFWPLNANNLPALKNLSLRGSPLEDFPLPILKMGSSLERLDLRGTGLTALPEQLLLFPQLKQIVADKMLISALPTTFLPWIQNKTVRR